MRIIFAFWGERRRSFASLRMTGWGVTPNAVRGLLFKSRRWTDPPPTLPETQTAEISRFARDDRIWESFLPFGEKLERGAKPSFQNVSLRGAQATRVSQIWGGKKHPLKTPPNALNPLWGKFERGTFPLSIEEEMSHFVRHDGVSVVTPRRLCEESPLLNRGGHSPPPTPPKEF